MALASFQTAVTGALPIYRNAQRPGEPLGLTPVQGCLSSQGSLGNPLVEGLQNMQGIPGRNLQPTPSFFFLNVTLACASLCYPRNIWRPQFVIPMQTSPSASRRGICPAGLQPNPAQLEGYGLAPIWPGPPGSQQQRQYSGRSDASDGSSRLCTPLPRLPCIHILLQCCAIHQDQ